LVVVLPLASMFTLAQTATAPGSNAAPPFNSLFARHYTQGKFLAYHMTATNEGHTSVTRYEADAKGIVSQNASGHFVEEFQWTGLSFNGARVVLPAGSAEFRQQLSLDPAVQPSLPDFSQVSPMLIGPCADLLTFYADLWIAIRQGSMTHVGDHAHVKHGTPNSWADGKRTLVGQDSIDFDVTLAEVNTQARTAKIVVRHVPPTQAQIQIPAKWMETPISDAPNNWVQVSRTDKGNYVAEIGKETFDVEISVSLVDGEILSATMDNPVSVLARECADAELAKCGNPERYQIRREIEIRLMQ
jgi:hypothetical protein